MQQLNLIKLYIKFSVKLNVKFYDLDIARLK